MRAFFWAPVRSPDAGCKLVCANNDKAKPPKEPRAESGRPQYKRMARIGTTTLTGQSGSRYPFIVYSWGTKFRPIPAVYFISKRTERLRQRGIHSTIYVGQSSDLSEVFNHHPQASCFQQYEANTVSIHQQFREATRLLIEADLIEALNPPCNA